MRKFFRLDQEVLQCLPMANVDIGLGKVHGVVLKLDKMGLCYYLLGDTSVEILFHGCYVDVIFLLEGEITLSAFREETLLLILHFEKLVQGKTTTLLHFVFSF